MDGREGMTPRGTPRVVASLALALLVAAVVPQSAPAQANRVLVYAIVQQEEAARLVSLFRERTGLAAEFVRGSGGTIVTRVIAERPNPRADVVLGGASNLHLAMKAAGALLPYVSPITAAVPRTARDPVGYWTGFYYTALGFGVNVDRFKRKFGARPLPTSWEELADRAFRGEIVMTDPVASSTAYLFLSGMLQLLGPEKGWQYFDRLVPNVAQFPSSGSAPPRMLGAGEYAIGISFVHSFGRVIEQGFPVKLVIPEPTPGEVGAVSIIAGGPNPEGARRFVEFMMSREAQQAYTDLSYTTPVRTDVKLPPGAVPRHQIKLMKYDPEAAARDRDAILREWTRRFGAR
ncbi:MAG: ABC transporter substrate-binding protein [Armatimonadota bacterium]|nr:ABC transporter substrate-binding protein [Armatimonadota bacterium]